MFPSGHVKLTAGGASGLCWVLRGWELNPASHGQRGWVGTQGSGGPSALQGGLGHRAASGWALVLVSSRSPGRQLSRLLPAPPGAWGCSRDGGKGLGGRFGSRLCLLSDTEQILVESLELLASLSPLAPLKAGLQLLPSSASTLGTAWAPALPCCTLCAGEALHG